MRSVFLCALLAAGVAAEPLTFPAEPKAWSFTVDVPGQWQALSGGPGTFNRIAEDDPDPDTHPQSLSGFATYDRDAANLVANLRRFSKGQFEFCKLGELDAAVAKTKDSFQIHAGSGATKITINYSDGRDSSLRTPYDPLLQGILGSFRWKK